MAPTAQLSLASATLARADSGTSPSMATAMMDTVRDTIEYLQTGKIVD